MIRPAILLAALTWTASAAAETRFLTEADDIPLPPALTEIAGGFVFASTEGRIVEERAEGAMPEADLRAYYEAALPALGWARAPGDALMFQRGREKLVIETRATAAGLEARFRITAGRASMALD